MMARIPMILAAATLALSAGVAQAQMTQMPQQGGMGGQAPQGVGPQYNTPGMPLGTVGPTNLNPPGVVPLPPHPFAHLDLPNQNVGNGAYNGGGMIIEYLPDGTRVQIPR